MVVWFRNLGMQDGPSLGAIIKLALVPDGYTSCLIWESLMTDEDTRQVDCGRDVGKKNVSKPSILLVCE